jgi:hypothetical protein
MPANFYKKWTGTIIDKYKSIQGQQSKSYTDFTEQFILIVRYPSGVVREIVDENTYYNFEVGRSITFKKIDRNNWANTWRVVLGFVTIVIMFLIVVTYKKPEPTVKAKARFPIYSDFNDDDY